MAVVRSSPNGWIQQTGTLSRATPTGWVNETASVVASPYPVLSDPMVSEITITTARPRVTITF